VIVLRSLVFQILLYAWTASIALALLPLLLAPARWVNAGARVWVRGAMFLARAVVGLNYEVRGGEKVPKGAAVIASKHQSMWETMIFHLLLDKPVYILKKELTRIPAFGWLLIRAGSIAIDRSAGGRALKHMTTAAKAALAGGHKVIIFPEGTRTAVGSTADYQPGVGMLYGLGAPVVPVALNSGLFWGRHTFRRNPGTIAVEFLDPMPQGMDRRAFVTELQARIEEASRRLQAEAEGHAGTTLRRSDAASSTP
jgi:1-acyl-sn-glycerol-3-phosphate acyltransferase